MRDVLVYVMHLSMLSRWGQGRPGKGGGFELRSSFQIKCPTPGKLTLVERVQIPHPRDISIVQKNANSPPLSRKRHRSVKKRIKHQKVVTKRLQSDNFKMQRLFNIKCHLIYIKIVTTP